MQIFADSSQGVPDSVKVSTFVVAVLLVVFQAAQRGKTVDQSPVTPTSETEVPVEDAEIEEAVADLSQTVVILTKELKAFKDDIDRPRRLKQLQLQNAALEKELENTKVKAQTLVAMHVSRVGNPNYIPTNIFDAARVKCRC